MNFVSLLGLFFMLFLAWAISYHRSKIQFRPIAWGMSLQFVLALTILNDNRLSYVGMSLIGLLLVCYNLRDFKITGKPPADYAMYCLAGLAVGAGFYFAGAVIPYLVVGLVLLIVLNVYVLKKDHVENIAAAAIIAAGIAWTVHQGMFGKEVFDKFSSTIETFLGLSDYGAQFLFGNLAHQEHFFNGNEYFPGFGFQFAFKVLPTIIFFGGFMSVLYYLGIIQKVISSISHFMRWTMGTSGAETLSCSANIFVGQTEAPLLIKPFLNEMTKSELLTVMVGGFATIAGGVLAGYINMGLDAGHLIAASVMSAPAALVMGKIIYPETEHSATAGDVPMPQIEVGENILEAAAGGISDGLKLALNVGAMLIGFIALIAVVDVLLNTMDSWIDGALLGGEIREYTYSASSPITKEYAGIFPGSLQTFFGAVLSPLAWLMGVPWKDAPAVANLLGMKLSLNEFVAFGSLGQYVNNGVISEKAAIISTYALCGFANFSSIGVQLGGLASLAPERKSDLAKVVFKAMIGGALASWTTACIAGFFLLG